MLTPMPFHLGSISIQAIGQRQQLVNSCRYLCRGLPREEYLTFLERLLALARQNAKETTQLASINADWRDFQGTPAKEEDRANEILVTDYIRVLNQSGWEETHISFT